MADALDRASPPPPPSSREADPRKADPPPDRWLDSNQAARIARVGYSTLYRWTRRHPGLGSRLPSGQFRYSQRKLLALCGRGDNGDALGDNGDVGV